MNGKKQDSLLKTNRKFLFLVFLEGIAAAVWLLLIPKEAGNAQFLGYSFRRLAFLIPILGLAGLALFVRAILGKNKKWQALITNDIQRAKVARLGILLGFLAAFLTWSFAFFFHFLRLLEDIGAYIRLLPVIVYTFLVGLEMILFLNRYWLGGKKAGTGKKAELVFRQGRLDRFDCFSGRMGAG